MISRKSIISISTLIATTIIFSGCSTHKNNDDLSQSSNTTTSTSSDANSKYIDTIFNKDKVININIEINESDWQNMLDTAIEENYTSADITINGKTYNNVGIRPKGNSSLSQIYSDDSTDRYSFKIKFDKYVDGQTLDGLSKLVLNNNMSDTTYMKEYLSYDLLSTLGVKTPAYTYANITVNGEEWGLYLAVEPIEEEFIERYYGSVSGNLYKPESDSIAIGDKQDNPIENNGANETLPSAPPNMTENGEGEVPNDMSSFTPPDQNISPNDMSNFAPPDQNTAPNDMSIHTPPSENPSDNSNFIPEDFKEIPNDDKMFGDMNKNSDGADLVWNGNDISNYSAIFDNTEFKTTTSDDYVKILDMIEHLDSLDDIESYLNVDEVLKYFAANTFLVNLDSYASNMKHNYYLYEENDLVTILPWDYNLSFAGFQAGTASNAINFPIDSPVSDSLESSPLIGKLLKVDEYKELYHKYLNEIVENYITNGVFENTVNKIDSLISGYVKNDATAFYTFSEYKNSLSHLINFGYDRATSISAQLNGTQPSTSAGNIETTVDLSALGTQGGGKDKGDMNMPNMNNPNMPNMNNGTINDNNGTNPPNSPNTDTNNTNPSN